MRFDEVMQATARAERERGIERTPGEVKGLVLEVVSRIREWMRASGLLEGFMRELSDEEMWSLLAALPPLWHQMVLDASRKYHAPRGPESEVTP